jgi:cysteinyl-tRNA synthetase
MDINLSNTLTGRKEKFVPNKEKEVGIYSCGPTVYWNQHIGHMYAYVQWDVLVRTLKYFGYKTKWVMNLTDVGHMTSDEDMGEDKMEKGAKREGVSVWDIANKYIDQFKESMKLLGINTPNVLCRATDNIPEQIELNQKIENNGFAYLTKTGLVYDTGKFPDYAKFGNLNLEELKTRDDVETDNQKKLPWDFFLWAINPKHIMKWESPWGEGYPGWHIECTAMSTKYLGENFDIHTGGIEHIKVHHTNEIAQGYAAFGRQTANYWLHNGWLTGSDGEKMSKSLGNYVTAQELVEKGYDPLAMRYLILTSHYKKGLRFSWQSLDSAQSALKNLKNMINSLKKEDSRTILSDEKVIKIEKYKENFMSALSDDINVPQALATLWETVKSNIPSQDKYDLAILFDEVLGLGLSGISMPENKIPEDIKILIEKREQLRQEKKYQEADKIRDQIASLGYTLTDK